MRENVQTDMQAKPQEQAISTEKDDEMFAFLSMLDAGGIDTAVGMKYCMNDVAFYTEILKEFVSGADDREQALSKCLAGGDIDKYRIYVHSLKSSARTIDADELSKKAEDMENAAKALDIKYLHENHETLISMLKMSVGGILMAINMYE